MVPDTDDCVEASNTASPLQVPPSYTLGRSDVGVLLNHS